LRVGCAYSLDGDGRSVQNFYGKSSIKLPVAYLRRSWITECTETGCENVKQIEELKIVL
jgi:hypothetical protein